MEVGNYLNWQGSAAGGISLAGDTPGCFYRGGPVKTAILSGIDQALWDITGKAFECPFINYWVAPTRDRIRVYELLIRKQV